MTALQDEIIKRFVTRITLDLQLHIEQSITGDVVVLHATTIETTIYIYLPNATSRLPHVQGRTIHIDYDQLASDFEKVYARLASLYGKGAVIYARKTVVARVDKRVSLSFTSEHHLQLPLPGKYRYGLFYEGELVSIAIFSGGRHMRDKQESYRSFELLRFCHKSGYRVVGGLSKLIKAFIQDFHPSDIMTYVDRDWSQESNLQTLGFEERGTIPPQYYWVTGKERRPMKPGAELENLQKNSRNGYLTQNSGSTKFVLTL